MSYCLIKYSFGFCCKQARNLGVVVMWLDWMRRNPYFQLTHIQPSHHRHFISVPVARLFDTKERHWLVCPVVILSNWLLSILLWTSFEGYWYTIQRSAYTVLNLIYLLIFPVQISLASDLSISFLLEPYTEPSFINSTA